MTTIDADGARVIASLFLLGDRIDALEARLARLENPQAEAATNPVLLGTRLFPGATHGASIPTRY